MEIFKFLFLAVIVFSPLACRQNQIDLPREYSFIKYFSRFDRFDNRIDCQRGSDILQADDGGYLLFGTSHPCGGSSDTLENSFYLIKTDNKGILEWNRGYSNDAVRAIKMLPSQDGGYFLLGIRTSDPDVIAKNVQLLKVDVGGNLLWAWTSPIGEAINGPDFDVNTNNECVVISRASTGTNLFVIDGNNGVEKEQEHYLINGNWIKVRPDGNYAVLGLAENTDSSLLLSEILPESSGPFPDTFFIPRFNDLAIKAIPLGFELTDLDGYIILADPIDQDLMTVFNLQRDENLTNNNVLWIEPIPGNQIYGGRLNREGIMNEYIISTRTDENIWLISMSDFSLRWRQSNRIFEIVETGGVISTTDGGYVLTGTHGRQIISDPIDQEFDLASYFNLSNILIKTNARGELQPF